MKIPYGLSNFKKVREQGLEDQGSHLFLLRPRRFGKSLLISALEYYYDQNHADDFDALFGDLYKVR